MKGIYKNFKVKLLVAVLFLGCMYAFAQMKKDVNSSVGNADMMHHNLNFPNAINPAMYNDQKYERKNSPPIETKHPDIDWANKYSRGNMKK
jgi:hypothetical protein